MRRATLIIHRFNAEKISIHALHEESDGPSLRYATAQVQFQSTLSMRRATVRSQLESGRRNISIHALHEESDSAATAEHLEAERISIHALHEESDCACSIS